MLLKKNNSILEQEYGTGIKLMRLPQRKTSHSVMKLRKNQCKDENFLILAQTLNDQPVKNFRIESNLLNLKKKLRFLKRN